MRNRQLAGLDSGWSDLGVGCHIALATATTVRGCQRRLGRDVAVTLDFDACPSTLQLPDRILA
jgi:hypothetical protein